MPRHTERSRGTAPGASLKARALGAKPYAQTDRERGLISLLERNPDAIMARPADFFEANTMLHEMMARRPSQPSN